MTKFLRAERADIPVDTVLSLGAFNLDQILLRRPTFLEPEYPFEWTGVYTLKEGRYELSLNDGPDPNMSLIALANQDVDEDSLRAGAEWCVRGYSQPAQKLQPGCEIPIDKHIDLQLQSKGQKSFFITIREQMNVGLFTQHTAEEFDIKLLESNDTTRNAEVPINAERTWVAQHEHDDEVGSGNRTRWGRDIRKRLVSELLHKGYRHISFKGVY